MPLLQAEAERLAQNDLVRGVIETIIDADELFQFLPFVGTVGKSYDYKREGTLASAQFIAPNVDVPESTSTFTEVSTTLRIIAGDVDIDNFIAEVDSNVNDQWAIQMALKAKAVARLFSQKLISGDETTTYNLASLGGGSSVTKIEFSGLDHLVDTSGGMEYNINANANGDLLDFDDLDALLDKIKLGVDVMVMSRRTIRDYKKLCRALSNVTPEYVKSPSGQNLLAYSGVPILLNDFIDDGKTVGSSGAVCSSVYAARLNEADGVHAIYSGPKAGMRIVEIGQLEKRDATRRRIKWYVGMALKSQKSLAILRGVKPNAT